MNKPDIVYRQIFVSGKVQGVFFRETTRQVAAELQLSGGVRNLSDGRVEVQVAGAARAVESLIKWLQTGPKLAKVSTIEVIEREALERPDDFMSPRQNRYFEVWPTR
ncbi:MAG: acylphosphatase [Gammaproteobacteria bacterium]|jgi:acylphosphatase|nr:acylphosphatase [Gammaproteobacteria bacterium]